jgi:hypothetical protein
MNTYFLFVLLGFFIVLVIYLTIDPNIEKFGIEYSVSYPDTEEIKNKLTVNKNSYFSFFKLLDAQARNIKLSFKDFQEKYNSSILEISETEKNNFNRFYQDIVNMIPLKNRHTLLIPNLKIAKFYGIENNYPHTHNDIIFFNKSVFEKDLANYQSLENNKNLLSLAKILIHEINHVKLRENPVMYDTLFNQWGFNSISPQYLNQKLPNNIVSRIRINPDELPDYRFWVWRNSSIPLAIYSSSDVTSIKDTIYISVDWNNTKNYTYLDNNTDFIDYFQIHVNHYHPNEILAEYHSIYFMELTKQLTNTDITKTEAYKLFKNTL